MTRGLFSVDRCGSRLVGPLQGMEELLVQSEALGHLIHAWLAPPQGRGGPGVPVMIKEHHRKS